MNSTKTINRIKTMLRLDFYRLFHTPLFYIMIAIAAIIPAMVLTMAGVTDPTTGQASGSVIENVWQLVSVSNAGDLSDFASFATIDMVFIFSGILMAIFVAHDYSSGFVKNIFTVHSKKQDYAISKTIIGAFSGVAMIVTYILGAVIAGLLASKSFDVNLYGLIMCVLSKMSMMLIFCSLFLAIAIFFKDKLWLTIVGTFLLGMMLYPAASIANLDATFIILIGSIVGSLLLASVFLLVAKLFLTRRDLI